MPLPAASRGPAGSIVHPPFDPLFLERPLHRPLRPANRHQCPDSRQSFGCLAHRRADISGPDQHHLNAHDAAYFNGQP